MTDRAGAGGAGADGGLVRWSVDRLGDLVALVDAGLPDEGLGADDLLATTFEDDGVVLGPADGSGAVAVVRRPTGTGVVAAVQVVVVDPDARRRGLGRHLLDEASRWAAADGASHLVLGGAAPWYLWPGVDATATPALCLAEASGFAPRGCEVNLSLPTTLRVDPPSGVTVARALEEATASSAQALIAEHWPQWSAEVGRAVEQGTCLVAMADDRAVGVACHSVNRPGWLGPMATDPARQRAGVGAGLVSAVCEDLMVAGHERAEIAWVGPVRFYAKLGATVSRVFRTYAKALEQARPV